MSDGFAIVDRKEWGIYLGSFLGLGFWSRSDAGDQHSACVFPTEHDARTFVRGWENNNDPDCYRYVSVKSDARNHATVPELKAAGLEDQLGGLLTDTDYGAGSGART